MEIRLVIFLAFVSVTVITNTLLILFAYKAFANLTTKVTQTFSEFEKNSETRKMIDVLHSAAQQAADVTEGTKQRMIELDPVLSRAQDSYKKTLTRVDSKLEDAAKGIDKSAQKVKDAVTTPALSILAFASKISKPFNQTDAEDSF